jgi:aminopeptidase YwaD
MEDFEVKTSRILKEEAALPDGTRLQCSGVGNSLSTPPDGIEGDVVLLESTSPEALEKVKNKIAALGITLYEKGFQKVVNAGALALIYPSQVPQAPNTFRSIRAEYTEKLNIPAVTLAHNDVLSLLKGQKRLKIVTEVEKITAKSQNIIGEVPGTLEDEDILAGGHYDTVRTVLGAHDNAAGTAIVLELARIFAHEKLNRTLRLAAWGSEELGLRGSFNHAENQENVKKLRFYLNFDVHGILLGTVNPLNATIFGPEDLKTLFRFAAKELGITLQITSDLPPGGSDHMPLAFYGVPSVWLTRRGGATQIMHTHLEDLRWCHPQAFVSAGMLSQKMLKRLLKAEEMPFEKEIPPDIAKALEKRFADMGIKRK